MMGFRRHLALAGILLGAAGAALGQPLIVWLSIGLLSIALVLRLIAEFRKRRAASASDNVSADQDE